jgi:hypothetical protein
MKKREWKKKRRRKRKGRMRIKMRMRIGRMYNVQLISYPIKSLYTRITSVLTLKNSTFCPQSACVSYESQNKNPLFL